MATAKKSTTKRKTTKKGPAKKAAAVSVAAKRKSAVKKSSRTPRKSNNYQMRSFRVAKDDIPFNTLKITRQTVYWVILVSFIIFAQLWIIKLQIEVANLIEAQQITF